MRWLGVIKGLFVLILFGDPQPLTAHAHGIWVALIRRNPEANGMPISIPRGAKIIAASRIRAPSGQASPIRIAAGNTNARTTTSTTRTDNAGLRRTLVEYQLPMPDVRSSVNNTTAKAVVGRSRSKLNCWISGISTSKYPSPMQAK